MFSLDDEREKAETDCCGGFKACRNRSCDQRELDCIECVNDTQKALESVLKEHLNGYTL